MPGRDHALEQLRSAIGKTVASVDLIEHPLIDPTVHRDERMTIRFTDGSSLEIETGSNIGDLAPQFPGFKASRLENSFIIITRP